MLFSFTRMEDDRKAAFLIALMETPNLLSASLLMLDDQVIAANIGVRTGGIVSVGVFSYSPLYAAYSPGKILLLLLGQSLAEMNVHTLDLTPGGEWKDRFANFHDEVMELRIHFDGRTALGLRARDHMESSAKKLLSIFNLTPAEVRSTINSVKSAVSRWAEAISPRSATAYRYYMIECAAVRFRVHEPLFSRNRLSQLLDVAASDKFYFFLEQSLTRLEKGECFYAPVETLTPRTIFWVRELADKDDPLQKRRPVPQTQPETVLVYPLVRDAVKRLRETEGASSC